MDWIEYPKIQTIWKRESEKPFNIIPGEYSRPEFALIDRWHVTEKIDGMNMRIGWDGFGAEYRGRTDRAQIPHDLVKWLDENLPADKLAATFSSPAILFGEGYGAGIQKGGGNYCADKRFILFDVYIDGWWLEPESVQQIAGSLDIGHVPVLWDGASTQEAICFVTNGLDTEDGSSSLISPKARAEGIVCRTVPQLFNHRGERVIWKLKQKDYRQLDREPQ